ncbi:MAG: DUF4365 domain-containing protein [Planctomycetes bacterium]|nr:DUF4365 domain-containing protein [Planctomycetota bacterium]
MLTRNHRQEALCRAYVQAVAALAGVSSSVPTPDYGIDLSLRSIDEIGNQHQDAGVQLDLQLRSTTRATIADAQVSYDLDARTYEFLRAASLVPRILVVLALPDEESRWLSQSLEELILRRCAYWYSLRGAVPTTATSSVRVAIPRARVFSVEAVQGMMHRLAEGETP